MGEDDVLFHRSIEVDHEFQQQPDGLIDTSSNDEVQHVVDDHVTSGSYECSGGECELDVQHYFSDVEGTNDLIDILRHETHCDIKFPEETQNVVPNSVEDPLIESNLLHDTLESYLGRLKKKCAFSNAPATASYQETVREKNSPSNIKDTCTGR